jgi:hypothetical protein
MTHSFYRSPLGSDYKCGPLILGHNSSSGSVTLGKLLNVSKSKFLFPQSRIQQPHEIVGEIKDIVQRHSMQFNFPACQVTGLVLIGFNWTDKIEFPAEVCGLQTQNVGWLNLGKICLRILSPKMWSSNHSHCNNNISASFCHFTRSL